MIADSANDAHDFELWARQRFFADKARISRQRTNKFIDEMIAEGTIEELENHAQAGRPNRYRFLFPDLPIVFDTRAKLEPNPGGGVAGSDTPPTSTSEGGVTDGDRGVSPAGTGGVTGGDTGVSPEATQNPKGIPTQPNDEPNARAGSADTAASGCARAEDPSPSVPNEPDAATAAPDARGAIDDRLPGFAGAGADAPDGPPDSAVPPHADVARVIEHLGAAVAKHLGRRIRTNTWAKPIDLLLRRGPAEWADPEPIPVDVVIAVIDWTFGPGAVRDSRGFAWADQVRSGEALRRHWSKIHPKATARRLAPVARPDQVAQADREMAELRAEYEAGEITPEKLFPRQARLAREAAERAARRTA
jgi:hypothetical protein